jgi:hypothetical protein
MEDMETATEFDLTTLDRIIAFAYGNIKTLIDPICEWARMENAQG